jgi:hypothetical protein
MFPVANRRKGLSLLGKRLNVLQGQSSQMSPLNFKEDAPHICIGTLFSEVIGSCCLEGWSN